ncbi:MAG: hypothetical protein U0Q16_04105 [Bryobacteraceae bacterium]
MSFLDNLENSVKAMESRTEVDPEEVRRERASRKKAIEDARAAEPFAEALKTGAFGQGLLKHARAVGHSMRMLVRFTWLDSTLRLEAKERRVDLTPTPKGIEAVFHEDDAETAREMVDVKADPEKFVRRWLS